MRQKREEAKERIPDPSHEDKKQKFQAIGPNATDGEEAALSPFRRPEHVMVVAQYKRLIE